MKRREFLRNASLGGSALLFPVMRQIYAQANGAPPPVRFIFFLESNGRNANFYQPSGEIPWKAGEYNTNNHFVDLPLTAESRFPEGLKPLEPFRDRTTIIQGLSGRVVTGGAHSGNFGALGCYCGGPPGSDANTGKPLAETIDWALGSARPGSVFPLLNFGVSALEAPALIYNVSASGKDQALATICDPLLAYSSIFGAAADEGGRRQFQAKTNLLDFMVDEIKQSERQLAAAEREKFEQHLAAYESLRDRQSRLDQIKGSLKEHAPPLTDKYRSKLLTDRLDAHCDMAAAALISGLTNAVTIASGSGGQHINLVFSELGIMTNKHELGHDNPNSDGTSARQCLDVIQAYHTTLLARMLKKLDAVAEGDGTMLDNTLVLYMSDCADAHHPHFMQWPLLLIGNLGGRLKAGGRYLAYPQHGEKGHATIGDLYLAMLRAGGIERKSFGTEDTSLRESGYRHAPLMQLVG